MNTHNFAYKVVMLAMVFGLLAAPIAFAAEDKDDNPLYLLPIPSDNSDQHFAADDMDYEEVSTEAALSEEGEPVIIRDFNMDFVGPQWDRVPGKND